MPVKIEPNAEPIPGYRLIERLGGGGFGEVWKAEAPGGLMKAIKFVYGDLLAADDADGARAGQEHKALNRVREVRHSYILSIERIDVIDGQLIIVTELADRTLWDRFREVRNTGLPGVPRDELLRYMDETAEALDMMNDEFQLQHLDIKPQNLFLVHNHIKVADFGLAKDMGDKAAATMTGGVTPVYAAPETFDGWLSRFTDQYSLAIVYQEILTGVRPFTGGTMRQLVLQHLQGAPDLNSLPIADRPVISRALNKNPDERFPSCGDMVKALRAATLSPGTRPPAAAPAQGDSKPVAPREETSAPDTNDAGDDSQVTQGARGTKTPRPPTVVEVEEKGPSLENRPQLLPSRPGTKKPRQNDTPSTSEPAGGTLQMGAFGNRPGGQVATARPEREAEPGRGIVQPALVLGLGKLGLETLRQLRKLVTQEFGHADALPHVRLLGVDTDPETIHAAGHGAPDTLLRPYEMLLAKLHRPSHYLKAREGKPPPPDTWLNSKLLFRIPKQQNGAGLRPLGRLAFVDNYRLISRRLEGELQSCAADDTPREMAGHADLGLRTKMPRVYVVACLAGATGGAMFIDAAYVIRQILRKQGFPNAEVVGILLVPPPGNDSNASASRANTYAALTELNYFSSGQMFSARYDEAAPGARPFTEAGPPFQHCLLLNLPERASSTEEPAPTIVQAAQFLYRDVATVMGRSVDETRRPHQQAYHMIGQALYQSFGMYRLLWPRRRLLQQSARNLCKRLVDRWMAKDARAISEEVRTWSLERWEALGMRPENLIAAHQERCETNLKQSPERIFQGIIDPLTNVVAKGKVRASGAGDMNLGPVVQVMDQLEKLLGIPEECRPPGAHPPELGTIEKAVSEAAASIQSESEQKLLQVIVQLIERPSYRLAGAEEALRQFCLTVEQALQAQEPLAKELHDKCVLIHHRIQSLLETPPVQQETRTASMWKLGRRNAPDKTVGEELVELLKAFAKYRFQSLILYRVNQLYLGLRGHLSDQIREVGFCRQRLGELAGQVAEPSGTAKLEAKPRSSAGETYLVPEGCSTVAEAINLLDKRIDPEELAAFDERVQALVEKDYPGLVEVCMGPSNMVKNLGPAMLREAELFLEPFLQGASVADLFMKQKGGANEDPRSELLLAYDEAVPDFGKGTSGKEICVVVVPSDEPGEELGDALRDILPGAAVVGTDRSDEIVFYREQLQLTGADLEQLGPGAQEAFRQREAQDPGTLHCREDIVEWETACKVTR